MKTKKLTPILFLSAILLFLLLGTGALADGLSEGAGPGLSQESPEPTLETSAFQSAVPFGGITPFAAPVP